MKFKKIPHEYIKVILDRLIRLKPACERYERVFNDILNKFLIKENGENIDFSNLDLDKKNILAAKIFNASIEDKSAYDGFLNVFIKNEEDRIFNTNNISNSYLDVELNLAGAFKLIKDEPDLKSNLKWILYVNSNRKKDPIYLREKYSLAHPIEKILLCEGATEEILLGELAKIYGYDFDKEGVYILGAGGKNQVARKYYKMIEEFKIPIFVLLDADADSTKELILPRLRPLDKIYVIKSGEFEDILPKNLIINALNERYKSCYQCSDEDFCGCEKTAKELCEIFKQKGFGEFKKADFAKTLKNYMLKYPPKKDELTDEAVRILEKIKSL